MKRVQLTLLAVAILAGLAFAQSKPTGDFNPTGKPAVQTPPAQTPPPVQQAPGTKAPPQAKTQDEFKTYQEAAQAQGGAASEKAADEFAAKFKTSELTYLLYYRATMIYRSENNRDQALVSGRKVLALNPNEPITLATVANIIGESTRDTDLDRDQKLNEALKDGQKALQTVDTDLMFPAGTPQAEIDGTKNLVRAIANESIALVYMAKNNDAEAINYLKKATELNTRDPDPTTWLRYSVVLDHLNRYQEALMAANKALDLSPAGSPQATLAKQERERLLKLTAPGATPTATPATPK